MPVVTDSPFTPEELEPTLRPLLEASLLPSRAYTDESVAGWEARNFFLGGWICVGHVSAFQERGQYVTAEVAGESMLFVGERGFYNVCRHRGARLLTD
jgi:choline monooxygenase